MRTRTLVLAAALLLALVAGGGYALLGPAAGGTLTEQWVSETERSYQQNHHPVMAAAVDGETVVVAPINELGTGEGVTDTSCALVRLDPADGSTVWQAGLPAENCTTHALTEPAIDDLDGDGSHEVLSATGEHRLAAHDAETGDEVWRQPTTSLGYSRPATADLLPADGREVVAVDLNGGLLVVHANGTTAWQRNHDAATWADPQVADFDGDGDREIAVATDGATYLYEADGELLWERARSARYLATGEADGDAEPELFVASVDEVTALDGETGEAVWTGNVGTVAKLHSVGDGDGDGTDEAYLGLSGGTVLALDATDGTEEWSSGFPGENRIMPPPTLGDVGGDAAPELVVGTQAGAVYVVDPASGEQVAAYERAVPVWTYPTLADIDGDGGDEVLVTYGDGRIVALDYEA